MAQSLPYPGAPSQAASSSVLAIPAFRRLWNSMLFSSFGDWLGLLATTALAQQLAHGNYTKANYAIAGVFIVRLLPAVFLGPIAGVIADRFDRRRLMMVCDILRFALYLSIPIVGNYFWMYTATILVESVTLFWSPAKEASVPNLVPKDKLESANQVTLLASYGTAPIAAILFSIMAIFSAALTKIFPERFASTADLALYLDAISFLYTAWVVYTLKSIPKGSSDKKSESENIGKSLIAGFSYVNQSKVIRGLIFGMLGAFVAAGAVIGLARTFVGDLHAGDAAYGILFGAVFTGLALGIAAGPKVFAQFSRRRLFGAALAISSFFLILLSLISNLVLAMIVVIFLGAFAGVSFVTGFTMLGLETDNEIRGRVFAFVQSLIRIALVLVLAVAPVIAAAIGRHKYHAFNLHLTYNGAAFTMLIAGAIGMLVGVTSYFQMRDRPSISLLSDIRSAFRGELGGITRVDHAGLFISFEGGEGAGKSTQTQLLKSYLESIGEKVVLTREPGGTELGVKIREILLANETGEISPRAEALMYAADRAHHVYSKIRPALEAGEVVITDRYMDSSIAYQGAGRVLNPSGVARISRWATENLMPTLTIILDLPAKTGLGRLQSTDRLESEPLAFHERVREEFLNLANVDPDRFYVVDATQDKAVIHAQIVERVNQLKELKVNARANKDFHTRNKARHSEKRAAK
jgi:dTMP kinase